jgi:glycerol-3-phosphate dehydrogenase
MNTRQTNWEISINKTFDVLIIGAGINGTSIYKKLCSEGYKVLIIDKGDISCGTSQASGMMVWGGLLYLEKLDFLSVYNFSKDRDMLISSYEDQVDKKYIRFILNNKWGRNKHYVYTAFLIYWLLGFFKREKPAFQDHFDELDFIKKENCNGSILYQEGFIKDSDSRFVLNWIKSCQSEQSCVLNYCEMVEGTYNQKEKLWTLSLNDTMSDSTCSVKAKLILNCSGVWVDKVNQQFGIISPVKHVFSKGVFIGFKRPDTHNVPLIFEMGDEHGDALAFIPWGPISGFGSNEKMTETIEEGFNVEKEDIEFLLKHVLRNLQPTIDLKKIVSLRCGLRPLVVDRAFDAKCYPLEISRDFKIVDDQQLPWISCYGGKISGCLHLADNVFRLVSKKISSGLVVPVKSNNQVEKKPTTKFPGLKDEVPTVDWCVNNEFCCTLEDYLRRRTNISQWIPREGLGFNNENAEYIEKLSQHLPANKDGSYNYCINEYIKNVHDRFDQIVNQF